MTNNLNNTKKKLTILFTVIVFFLAFILEFVYFSTKYYSIKRFDLNNFNVVSKNIELNILSGDNFINSLSMGAMHRGDGRGLINNFLSKNQINFLVINNLNNEIVFNRVFEYIDEEILIDNINKIKDNNIIYNKGYYFKKNIIKNDFIDYQLIFFKKPSYSFPNYFLDLMWFVVLTLGFSIVIYLIGIKFIGRLLKPVEDNILDMQNFIHNAGHELKTPISVINSNLQLLNELKIYDEKLTKENILEIKKLDKLIEGLIELSDINDNNSRENLNIGKQIEEIISDYDKKIKEKILLLKLI